MTQIEVTVHEDTGSTYVYLQQGARSVRTDEVEEGFLVDFDAEGGIIGFEVLADQSDSPERQAITRVMAYLASQVKSHTAALDELREYATAV